MAFKGQPIYRGSFSGDVERCRGLLGFGERQMDILRNSMKFQNLTNAKRRIDLDHDTVVIAEVNHKEYKISIWCRPLEGGEKLKEREVNCICSCCFTEAEIFRVGGTERDEDGEIIFQGDFEWGNPRLRYDLLLCYKKSENLYLFYKVENIRPSDFTHYAVGDQCIVVHVSGAKLTKCASCDNCADEPESEDDTLCSQVTDADLSSLIILPIDVSDHFKRVTYSPVLTITETEFRLMCVSICEVQSLQFPTGGSGVYDTAELLTETGIYGAITADVKYNGYTGLSTNNRKPSCAFRYDDIVLVLHTPVIVPNEEVTYEHNVVSHMDTSLPTRVVNGTTYPVPFDDVLYMWLKGYNDDFGEQSFYILDAIRGGVIALFDKDTGEEIDQPISYDTFFDEWPLVGWANRLIIRGFATSNYVSGPDDFIEYVAVDKDETLTAESVSPECEYEFLYDEMRQGRMYSSFAWVTGEWWNGTIGFRYYPYGYESGCVDGGSTKQSVLVGPGGDWLGAGCFWYQCNDQHVTVPGSTLHTATGYTCQSNACEYTHNHPYAPATSKKYAYGVNMCAKVVSFSVKDDSYNYSDGGECTSEIHQFDFWDTYNDRSTYLYTKNITDQTYDDSQDQLCEWEMDCYYEPTFKNKYTDSDHAEWHLAIHSKLGERGSTDNAFFAHVNTGRFQYENVYCCFDFTFKVLVDMIDCQDNYNLIYLNPGTVNTESYDLTTLHDETVKMLELGEVNGAVFTSTVNLTNASNRTELFMEENLSTMYAQDRYDLLSNTRNMTESHEFLKSCEKEVRVLVGIC